MILYHQTCILMLYRQRWSLQMTKVGGILLNAKMPFSRQKTEEKLEKARELLKGEKKSAHYILDQNVADCVVEKVSDQLPEDAVVLECNPGLGLITKGLLKCGKVSKIIATEARSDFLSHLQRLRSSTCKIRTEQINVLAPRRLDEKEAFYRVINHVTPRPWQEDPPLSVIGVLPTTFGDQFMTRLVLTLASQDFIYSLGRTQCFLFISANQFRKVIISFPTVDNRVHHQTSILYNLLFHADCLMQVDKKLFSPPIPSRKKKLISHPLEISSDSLDPDMMYLVHLKPKTDLAETVVDWPELPKFVAFLKQITRIKSVRLIPKMESWIPGCGVHLILMKYTMMDYVHDLVPQQYVTLYKEMVTWPEYHESSLQLLLEKEVAILNEDEGHYGSETSGETAVT